MGTHRSDTDIKHPSGTDSDSRVAIKSLLNSILHAKNPPDFKLSDNNLEVSNVDKYVGHFITEHVRDDDDIHRRRHKNKNSLFIHLWKNIYIITLLILQILKFWVSSKKKKNYITASLICMKVKLSWFFKIKHSLSRGGTAVSVRHQCMLLLNYSCLFWMFRNMWFNQPVFFISHDAPGWGEWKGQERRKWN